MDGPSTKLGMDGTTAGNPLKERLLKWRVRRGWVGGGLAKLWWGRWPASWCASVPRLKLAGMVGMGLGQRFLIASTSAGSFQVT